MKTVWKIVLLLGTAVLLGGCSGRELEDREFPSALTISDQDLEKQKESSKYLDYSQTKAVILEETLLEEPDRLQETVKYLKDHPEFARNMLIFVGSEEVLELAGEQKDDIGNELQDYYKNRVLEEPTVTLTDLINFYHNKEESLTIPTLNVSGEKLFPKGTVKLNNQV